MVARPTKMTGRRAEKMVARAADEILAMVAGMEDSTARVLDNVNAQALSIWSTYALLRESKRLTWLTAVLVALTVVLAFLTARLAGL